MEKLKTLSFVSVLDAEEWVNTNPHFTLVNITCMHTTWYVFYR